MDNFVLLDIVDQLDLPDIFACRHVNRNWASIGIRTKAFKLFSELNDIDRYPRYQMIVDRLYQTDRIDILVHLCHIDKNIRGFVFYRKMEKMFAHSFDCDRYRSLMNSLLADCDIPPFVSHYLYVEFPRFVRETPLREMPREIWGYPDRPGSIRSLISEYCRVASDHRSVLTEELAYHCDTCIAREIPPGVNLSEIFNSNIPADYTQWRPSFGLECCDRNPPTEAFYASLTTLGAEAFSVFGPAFMLEDELRWLHNCLQKNNKSFDDLHTAMRAQCSYNRRIRHGTAALRAVCDNERSVPFRRESTYTCIKALGTSDMRDLFGLNPVSMLVDRIAAYESPKCAIRELSDRICKNDRLDWALALEAAVITDETHTTALAKAMVQEAIEWGSLPIFEHFVSKLDTKHISASIYSLARDRPSSHGRSHRLGNHMLKTLRSIQDSTQSSLSTEEEAGAKRQRRH